MTSLRPSMDRRGDAGHFGPDPPAVDHSSGLRPATGRAVLREGEVGWIGAPGEVRRGGSGQREAGVSARLAEDGRGVTALSSRRARPMGARPAPRIGGGGFL